MSQPLLRADGLERRYGARVVVSVDELEVNDGEVVAVLGPNGSGKSTLFRMLLLLEPADAGRITMRGELVGPEHREARRRMAGVFQRPHLFAGTVMHNVGFGPRARGLDRATAEAAALRALATVGLSELPTRRVETLSGGEVQRVALARALAAEPELLLLDEPTASLDAQAKRSFREDLEGAVRRGARAVLLITHDAADAMALADRIVVLEAGRIVQAGTPADLLGAPATSFVATFTGAELLLDGTTTAWADGIATVRVGGNALLRAVTPCRLETGTRVHVAYRPEDVVLSSAADGLRGSARNVVAVRVVALTPASGFVRCRLAGAVELVALVTRESAAELALQPGRAVSAHLKVTALRAYPAS